MDKKIIYFVFALWSVVFLSSCGEPPSSNQTDSLITATVTGKEHIVDYDEGDPKFDEEPCKRSYYLIYTDKEVFKIDDSLILGRFNSSDIYSMMKKGKYYRIKTFGVLSMYQNIIEVEALE